MPGQFLRTNLKRAQNFALCGANDPPLAFIDDAHQLVYIDNPKVASTSIKQALFGGSVDFNQGRDSFHNEVDGFSVTKLPPRALGYSHFFIVRNPYSRLVSNFRDKVEGKTPREWGVYNVRYFRYLFRYLGQLDLQDEPVLFDQFAMAVTRIPDWLGDRHFASQSRWIGRLAGPASVRVLRIESLAEDWPGFAAEHGLPDLHCLNQTPGTEWRRYYTSRDVIDAVAKRYQSDLAHFSYPRPDQA